MRLLFESLPILLAAMAIVLCFHKALTTRRMHDRVVCYAMIACSVVMIIAQSSWTYTVLKGGLEGTDINNVLWTIFNAGVMSVFIFSARRSE